MRYDVWMEDRDRAEVCPNGVKVLRDDGDPKRLGAKVWFPKAIKPFWDYKFNTVEARERAIAHAVEFYTARTNSVRERRAKRAGSDADLEKVSYGTIFCNSWGYEQTNVDFYQVVERRGRVVKLRRIATSTVPGSEGFMSDRCVPVKDAFLEARCDDCGLRESLHMKAEHAFRDGTALTKRLQFSDGAPYLSMGNGWCGLWDGTPHHRSWYA